MFFFKYFNNKIQTIFRIFSLTAAYVLFVNPGYADQRPNIILIMADDHARQAISCYGSKIIQTPGIDRIAREGLRFTNCFVTNSICAPSRAVILTGKYSHINGLRDNRDEFDPQQTTFPKILQQAGYFTAVVGKWHLKSLPTGFDYWNVLVGQGNYYNPRFIAMGDTIQYTGYATDIITDLAIEVLEKSDREKPFCLLYYHKAPHRNWMPNLKHLEMFEGNEIPLPETFYDDYATRSAAAKEQDMEVVNLYNSFDMKLGPGDYQEEGSGGQAGYDARAAWENTYHLFTEAQKTAWDAHYNPLNRAFRKANLSGKALAEWKFQRYIKDYLRCVVSIDENVTRLLDYLDREGLAQNTIVIYTSDQGFFLGEHGWYDKRFMYEESSGIPLLIRYPKEISPGTVSDLIALNLDFAPTLLDYAGMEIPPEMQGQSFRAIARGKRPENWRKSMYYHYYEYPHGWHKVKRHYGVRTRRYKLIHFYDDIDAWELYDLQNDPHELRNLYHHAGYQGVVSELKAEIKRLQKHYRVEEPFH